MEVSGKKQTATKEVDAGALRDPCLLDNKKRNAKVHQNSKVSGHHKLVNKEEMPRRKPSDGTTMTGSESVKDVAVDLKSVKANFVKKIYIQHNQERFICYITGCVLINDDKLCLVDNTNYSVKVVDLNTDTITAYITLDVQPRDLACIDPNTLVVTSYRQLTYLRYDGKLSLAKQVQVEAGCQGIACNNNKLYVTILGHQPCVKICDKDGNVLDIFKTDKQGQMLFVEPRYIAVSGDNQLIYVSDFYNNTIQCLNMNGDVVGAHKYNNLMNPLGLTVVDKNIVYVCGLDPSNVHIISSQCELIQDLLGAKDGVKYPRTLVYGNKDRILYITHYLLSGRSNFLSVFKL